MTQCWVDVRPPSSTVGQHYPSIGWRSDVCWDNTTPSRLPLNKQGQLIQCCASVVDSGPSLIQQYLCLHNADPTIIARLDHV